MAQRSLHRAAGCDGLDLAFGVVACLALWWRRTRPVPVMLLALGVAAFSPLALGAGLAVLFTAASRVRGRALALVVVATIAGSVVWPLVNPAAGETVQLGFPAFLVTMIAFGWGLYLRERRELVASLRERADRLEADQRRSAEAAREAERRRIAREMHDVLAHRLSLLSVHAGALEFRPGAPEEQIAQAATVIRTSAAAALSELRQIVSVLREDSDQAAAPPQPGFGQLGELLAESRSAGMTLRARIDLPGAAGQPEVLGRTVYRVVQEGLTNARKHAPGAAVEVTVTGDSPAGLVAEVISGQPRGTANAGGAGGTGGAAVASGSGGTGGPALAGPGAEAGLIGLAERLALAGGRLEHGTNPAGEFVLRATIPRPP